jgi:prepilin-type N-terminal cleavage/methylation domain-containing protein
MSDRQSFTLIELLVVIGILAILTAAVVLVLNPVEYLKQARDTTRMNDLDQINQALSVLESQGVTSFGTANTVYVSIPDSSAACANLGLPALPAGYSYACAISANLQKIDSTGWIPVNFTQSTTLSFSTLPIDSINTTSTGSYYTYTPGGSWELDAILESGKYRANTTLSKANLPGVYAKGSNLTLSPLYNTSGLVGYWNFEEGGGGTIFDKSGNNDNGTWHGSGTHYVPGKVGSYAGQFNRSAVDYVDLGTAKSAINLGAHSLSIAFWYQTIPLDGNTVFSNSALDGNAGYGVNITQAGGNVEINGTQGGRQPTNNHQPGWAVLADGNWHFMAFVIDSSAYTVSYYSDGIFESISQFSSWGNADPNPADNAQIGRMPYGDCCTYTGTLDDFRIYNRVLSAAEILAIYNATN